MDSNLESVLSDQEPAAVEPAEAPPQTQQEPTGEEASAPPAPPPEDPIETHRKGLETAVVAERRKRQEAEQRAQALEARIAQFSQQQQPQRDAEPPDPAQYQENPQEYWRLLARYEARQEIGALVKQQEERQTQEAQRQAQQATADRVNTLVAAGQAKYGDYDAVINAGLGPFLNDTMRDVLANITSGPEVSYWLAKNPAEAARVSSLAPMKMAIEIAMLQARAIAPPKPAIPQTLTQARDSRGQFAEPGYAGHTPLDAILNRK